LVPHVASLGFDLIEVPIENIGDLDLDRVALAIRDHGLATSACVAISSDRDLIHPDPTVRQTGMTYVHRCIEAAEKLGAENLVGPFYSAVGRVWQATRDERKRDMDLLVHQLRTLAADADNHGVVLCVEPLNRFETSFINLASQVIDLVDRIDHPSCQVMLDTFHMNIEERSIGNAIRSVGARLRHFHACENDRGAPGSGHVPWVEVGQALKDINYAGPVVIESFSSQVKSIARAAAIWRPLAASQDDLARDGLEFLEQLLLEQ